MIVIENYIRSPINYMGGKYRSLKYIIPLFPKEIDTFYDLFSGSGSVFLNTKAKNIISNDIHNIVINLQQYISENEPNDIYDKLNELSQEYNLAGEESSGYNTLREIFNKDRDMLKLLALSQHSFNFLIRFNTQAGFNASHGKGISKLSKDFLDKLINFNSHVQKTNTKFISKDFRKVIELDKLKPNDLIYCDPPYLLSEAVYNEKRAFGGWNKKDTLELLELLDNVHNKGSKFALSEMISSKGENNDVLIDWINKNNYSVSYNSVKYLGVPSTHNNDKKSVEVLITNY